METGMLSSSRHTTSPFFKSIRLTNYTQPHKDKARLITTDRNMSALESGEYQAEDEEDEAQRSSARFCGRRFRRDHRLRSSLARPAYTRRDHRRHRHCRSPDVQDAPRFVQIFFDKWMNRSQTILGMGTRGGQWLPFGTVVFFLLARSASLVRKAHETVPTPGSERWYRLDRLPSEDGTTCIEQEIREAGSFPRYL
ncbi:hypothetical protein BG015_006384 [Linnemannia schmuckeri]|uniref:Uncharacterized protein n=1 Tax=Linnemannia schmuckeri TaxID=64567 RepID=A0A9P5S2G2_9FUNG|nr:hypothetical protein BG015_006384 [Linnemannia schmuckeri]